MTSGPERRPDRRARRGRPRGPAARASGSAPQRAAAACARSTSRGRRSSPRAAAPPRARARDLLPHGRRRACRPSCACRSSSRSSTSSQLTWTNALAEVPAGVDLRRSSSCTPLGTRMLLSVELAARPGRDRAPARRHELGRRCRERKLSDIDWALAGTSSSRCSRSCRSIWNDLAELELARRRSSRRSLETAQIVPRERADPDAVDRGAPGRRLVDAHAAASRTARSSRSPTGSPPATTPRRAASAGRGATAVRRRRRPRRRSRCAPRSPPSSCRSRRCSRCSPATSCALDAPAEPA